ncbi:tetratricopeptide repeat protein [Desulfolithobacter sp.]
MSSEKKYTLQTLLISVFVALFAGFLSGVIYSVFNAPPPGHNHPPTSQNAGNPDAARAIASLEQETKNNPDNVAAWVQLGHAYFDTNQPAKAIRAYNRALELQPGDTNVLTDLAVMYRRNKQPEKAIATLDQALKINPRHEQALFNKGVILINDFQDVEGALAAWEELVRINPMAKGPSGALVSDIIKQVRAQVAAQQEKEKK